MNELWKPVPDYDGYQVSNFGRVKSFKRKIPRMLKPELNSNGYLYVELCKDSKRKLLRIHRLVAICFIPNPEGKEQVNHIDGNKFNNRVSNLEWATASENVQHAADIGLKPSGEKHHNSKLTAEQVELIRTNPQDLNIVELSKIFGVCPTKISAVQRGKTYKKLGGLIRQSKCPRLPDEVRSQIRAEYVFGSHEFGSYGLARKYGVSQQTIRRIIHEVQS